MSKQVKVSSTAGVLRDVQRKVSSLHRIGCKRETLQVISDSIKVFWEDEKSLREATISIGLTCDMDHEQVVNVISINWCEKMAHDPVVSWRDHYNSYCEFETAQEKNNFLDTVKTNPDFEPIKELIKEPNSLGHHFQRRPVKLIFVGVDARIDAGKVQAGLISRAPRACSFSEMRSGKVYGARQLKSISFTANAHGFEYIFKTLRGRVPYSDRTKNISIKLLARLNIKPYMCNKCYMIGRHDCKGKACAKCSSQGHTAWDCQSSVEFCVNCKKPTHKSNDRSCPTYLQLLVREIRKYDIPLEFLEDEVARFRLVSSLSIE